MDSTNMYHHHHHHHQSHEEQQLVESSTSSPTSLASSCFSTVADVDHTWTTPSFFLNNNGNIHATCGDEAATNSLNHPIIQEMGFPWPNDSISINHQSTCHPNHHQQQLIDDRIKEEPSSSTSSDHHHHNNPANFAKFSDMLSSSPTSPSDEMLLLKNTLSTTYKNLHQQPCPFSPSIQYQNATSSSNNKGISTTFSQIFPTVNISKMSNNNKNMSSASISSSSSSIDQMASNVMAGGFDLFATARLLSGEPRINQSAPSNSNNLLELFEGSPQLSVDHDLPHQSNDLKLCNKIANNVSSFNNDRGQVMEQQSAHQMPTKKQRFESRVSCPPLKVRKEKLGDRIAALQQLVSPFGKTDTASVLMEAIGYIKFLQNQVETLSVPYMKLASHSKNTNTHRVSDGEYCDSEEPKLTDLKSRGLCLVPTSCMSYINIASDPINGGVWPPSYNPTSNF